MLSGLSASGSHTRAEGASWACNRTHHARQEWLVLFEVHSRPRAECHFSKKLFFQLHMAIQTLIGHVCLFAAWLPASAWHDSNLSAVSLGANGLRPWLAFGRLEAYAENLNCASERLWMCPRSLPTWSQNWKEMMRPTIFGSTLSPLLLLLAYWMLSGSFKGSSKWPWFYPELNCVDYSWSIWEVLIHFIYAESETQSGRETCLAGT